MESRTVEQVTAVEHYGFFFTIYFLLLNCSIFCFQQKIAPRGFEPLKENQQAADNKRLTKNANPVLSTCLDKILQKYPEIKRIIAAWPDLPEHIKAAIKGLIHAHKPENK
ncbi:MAG: hypothetical protein JXB29_05390 [Sedimentisphaerales bacterium]|nr:hypothetical protein [Sedimentisphaerales bacterium]